MSKGRTNQDMQHDETPVPSGDTSASRPEPDAMDSPHPRPRPQTSFMHTDALHDFSNDNNEAQDNWSLPSDSDTDSPQRYSNSKGTTNVSSSGRPPKTRATGTVKPSATGKAGKPSPRSYPPAVTTLTTATPTATTVPKAAFPATPPSGNPETTIQHGEAGPPAEPGLLQLDAFSSVGSMSRKISGGLGATAPATAAFSAALAAAPGLQGRLGTLGSGDPHAATGSSTRSSHAWRSPYTSSMSAASTTRIPQEHTPAYVLDGNKGGEDSGSRPSSPIAQLRGMPLLNHSASEADLGAASWQQYQAVPAPGSPAVQGPHGGGVGLSQRTAPFPGLTASNSFKPAYGQRQYYRTDPVDEVLSKFSLTQQMDRVVTARREWRQKQLEQLAQSQERLQAAQAASYSTLESTPRATTPQLADNWRARSGMPAAPPASRGASARRTGGPAPPILRFSTADILRETQGAYLTSPEYSFSGSRPLKGQGAGSSGTLFERYTTKEENPAAVQNYYIRPDKVTPAAVAAAAQQPHMAQAPPTGQGKAKQQQGQQQAAQQEAARQLPNGVPLSRLERMRAVQEQGRKQSKEVSKESQKQAAAVMQAVLFPNAQPPVLEAAPPSAAPPGDFGEQLMVATSLVGGPQQGGQQGQLAATAAAGPTAEPLLDETFFNAIQAHFNDMAGSQMLSLQSKLNSGLPAIMQQFGVNNVVPQQHPTSARRKR